MHNQKDQFITSMNIKNIPNLHEKELFLRADKYISTLQNIRGISMIGICNSLSMFTTNEYSDIDLFIVTKPKMLWYVRFFVTLKFWRKWVWRKWDDIAGNFCLSFFATENALNMSRIAIKDDIYLYFWVYFLKPILDFDDSYEQFLQQNSWVQIDENQKKENLQFVKFSGKSRKIFFWHYCFNAIIRFFGERKTRWNWEKMGRPSGVIISQDMLKFHDRDQRENVRDAVRARKMFSKNF